MDFSFPAFLAAAFGAGLALPIILLAIVRIPRLAGRNPVQFGYAFLLTFALWALVIIVRSDLRPQDLAESGLALMTIAGLGLFYLEVWGLMSRGYTLGVLLTLLRSPHALDASGIADAYRGGDGLDWIVRHRLDGLVASRMLDRADGVLRLRSRRGLIVTSLYIVSIRILGLRKTG